MASIEEPQPAPYSITAIFSFPVMPHSVGSGKVLTPPSVFVSLAGRGHISTEVRWRICYWWLQVHTLWGLKFLQISVRPNLQNPTDPRWADGAVGERRSVVGTGGNSGICRWGQNPGKEQENPQWILWSLLFSTAFQSFQAQIEASLSFSLNSNSSDLFEPLKRVVNGVLSMLVLL